MAKYRRDHSLEEEIIEQEEINQEEVQEEVVEQLTPEEETYKKRYGDLRSHAQKRENELTAKLKELENKYEESVKNSIDFPHISSKEEAEAWVAKYPDLAKIFRYLALEQNKDVKEEFQKTKEQVEQFEYEKARHQAYLKLLELHPDFDRLKDDADFHDWLSTRSKRMQDALLVNIDPYEASDVIDVYKAQKKNSAPSKKKDAKLGAAEAIRTTSSNAPDSGEGEIKWSESYVNEMSKKDKRWYERNEATIFEMIRKGKFEFDITGAAR